MPKCFQTSFQHGQYLQYGLKVTKRDSTSTVLSVSRRFCLKLGREAKSVAKRKRTTNVQVFRRPFRTDIYKNHHFSAHLEMWSCFLGCLVEEREVFLDGHINNASTLLAQFESESALTITFNCDIVDVMTGDLRSDPDDESTQANA